MNRLINHALIISSLLVTLLLSACSEIDNSKYPELGWEDLRPVQELVEENSSSFGSLEIIDDWYGNDYVPGGGLGGGYSGVATQPYSSGIVAEVDNTSVRLPGFVVPVEFDEDNSVTEFFLVPYFGACYHKPPPPPNQTIYVTSNKPVEFDSIYDPVWIMGVLTTKQAGNSIASAAYSMDLHKLLPYDEE